MMEILGWIVIGVFPAGGFLLGFICFAFTGIGGAPKRSETITGIVVMCFCLWLFYLWWLIKPFTMSINPS